jgi:hypothetical protein
MNLVANELHDRKCDICLVTINRTEEDLVKIRPTHFLLNREKDAGALELIRSFLAYQKFISKFKPDIVIINCDLPELFAALSLTRAKHVIVEHANPAWSTRKVIGVLIRTFLLLKRSRFVAVSSHLRIWPYRIAPGAIMVNGLPKDLVAGTSRNKNLNSINRLVFIGRLANPQKRPEVLLEIARRTNFGVLFIGEGKESEHLRFAAKEYGLPVEFAGFIQNPWKLLRKTDLLIIPSLFEGDGLVVIEALASGARFLLSDIPDFRRFKLPDDLYCNDARDYSQKILDGVKKPLSFDVPETIRTEILSERDMKQIGDNWISYLETMMKS